MAFKGTAGVSASGASMSKYDVEVEARLKKLEAAVAALEKHSHDTPTGDVSTVVAALKAEFPGKFAEGKNAL
tara:strand:+ start:350 stop:565 length:216 start_codon:yes stop_codon:yes gene_type:complete